MSPLEVLEGAMSPLEVLEAVHRARTALDRASLLGARILARMAAGEDLQAELLATYGRGVTEAIRELESAQPI